MRNTFHRVMITNENLTFLFLCYLYMFSATKSAVLRTIIRYRKEIGQIEYSLDFFMWLQAKEEVTK